MVYLALLGALAYIVWLVVSRERPGAGGVLLALFVASWILSALASIDYDKPKDKKPKGGS